MNKLRCINTNIWRDWEFRALQFHERLNELKILIEEDYPKSKFSKYAKPFPPRPDLKTPEWRRLRKEIISERGSICEYCKKDCGENITIDHIVAVSRGGERYQKDNLIVCCRSCNSKKRDKDAPI